MGFKDPLGVPRHPGMELPDRVELSSPDYETGILPLKVEERGPRGGVEPTQEPAEPEPFPAQLLGTDTMTTWLERMGRIELPLRGWKPRSFPLADTRLG